MRTDRRPASILGLALVSLLSVAGCGDEPSREVDETVGCRLNSDCLVGERCVDGDCEPVEPRCQGTDCPCTADEQCAALEVCQVQTGACVAGDCRTDATCPLGAICVRQRCLTDVEADRDRDGVPDLGDGCPDIANADQDDLDGDGRGDVCDVDDDDDDVPDSLDNCPRTPNAAQADRDSDGQGDACEGDLDADGVPDDLDVCPRHADPEQTDTDHDGRGDLCEDDDDGDGVFDDADTCPLVRGDQADDDDDGRGNACDGDWDGATVRGRLVSASTLTVDLTLATVRAIGPEARPETLHANADARLSSRAGSRSTASTP